MDYIFDAVVALMATIVTYCVVPWVRARFTAEQRETARYWLEIAVSAAEQIFGGGTGAKKLEFVQKMLADKGIDVTKEEIESAVYWLATSVTATEVEAEVVVDE